MNGARLSDVSREADGHDGKWPYSLQTGDKQEPCILRVKNIRFYEIRQVQTTCPIIILYIIRGTLRSDLTWTESQ